MRYQPIEAGFFARNRAKLAERLRSNSIAFLNANDIFPTNADGSMAHKQNADLFYLTGVDQEETVLLLYPDAEDPAAREILFLKETSELIAIWEGKKLTKEQARLATGIENVQWLNALDRIVPGLIKQSDIIYCNINEHSRASHATETRDDRFVKKIKQDYPLHEYARLAPVLSKMRMFKEPTEVVTIQKACDITEAGFRRVLEFVRPGVGEWEIEAEFAHEFLRQKSRGFSYLPIIGSGANACVLHYIENDCVCADGEVILLDVGCEYGNYNADMTRSIPVNGKFTKRQRAVYESVLRILRGANELLRPGTKKRDYEAAVGLLFDKELCGLGLLTPKQVEDSDPKNPARRKYFMHSTSHFLGLDVHDVGDANPEFAPGMVFTIEPGIYIPEENLGIRLENNYLITEEKNIDLMANIPIEIDEIERIMAKNKP